MRKNIYERFLTVIELFCIKTPEIEIVKSWFESDGEYLQEWICCNLKPEFNWCQGIELIEFAMKLSENEVEGVLFYEEI